MKTPALSRRTFLKTTSVGSAALAFPYVMRSQQGQSPNSKLNVACIGVGGRGAAAVSAMKGENMVAFCDVDDVRAARTFSQFPQVPRFRDYRQLLDKLSKSIDAVTISTPDHMHYPIAMAAMALGKHVFVEKPMSHTIAEARTMAKVAREKKLATQMGNQGHASDGMRLLKEWFQAGVLGEVREIHTWTDRPIWPQGVKAIDHSKLMPVVPDSLSWDLWLGVAAQREFDPAYLPFNWRGFWDFGTGALGDMGCHMMDGGFWAFDLTAPTSIEAVSSKQTALSGPTASVVTYQFPARGNLPPLKWVWYDGSMEPVLPPEFDGQKLPENGTFIIGSKATVSAHPNYFTIRIIPETKMQAIAPSLPPKTLPRVPAGDHFAEWVTACKGGIAAGANFEYSSRLTEMVLLSNVAVRARHRIEWDSAAMKVTNYPAANEFITKQYRGGFGV
ncbi:Gfo/Idh/MocA family protein [Horticoccus sp. 23ND18S-11]|uniref:Gfo/Idh/MocA family protein n=1 Tax=Horticoccus sp. 23ND18S-11 TaxID=3391832 RepID=UPI0039C8CFF4